MRHTAIIRIFAIIEILIGTITLVGLIVSLLAARSIKPPEVYLFVTTTSLVSAGLGIGLLKYNRHAYHMLLYLSSVIILSKLLIFAKIIALSGALETTISTPLKNGISVLYHGLIIFYFTRRPVKDKFKVR